MYRKLLYGIILFSAFAQAFVQPLIYLEYQLRKEYIVAELCKERYATINTCVGRCFLVRKLNDAQQKESEEKERSIRPVEILLQLAEINPFTSNAGPKLPLDGNHSLYLNQYFYLIDQSIDEPPKRG